VDIEVHTPIFEARILAESIAMGLARLNDPSEIDVVRRMQISSRISDVQRR